MVPPLAASVAEYAALTVPADNDVVVTVGGCAAAAIEMLSACVPVLCFASFTCTVNDELPEAVGVPEMVPDDAARLKPAGRAPAVMLQV